MLEAGEALNDWKLWGLNLSSTPRIIDELDTGLTNTSYLIQSGQSVYRLRLNSPISQQLGIDRHLELTILTLLEPLGITPRLLFSGLDFSYSIFEYIEGQVCTTEDIKKPEYTRRLSHLITKYQTLGDDLPNRNYLDYLDSYIAQLDSNALSSGEWARLNRFQKRLNKTKGYWPSSRLCHHDLIASNIIDTGDNLYILDWEYAAKGCGDLDYLSLNTNSLPAPNGDCKELAYWLNTLWSRVQL
jgi:thiamine kinase-like enzyme